MAVDGLGAVGVDSGRREVGWFRGGVVFWG